MSFLNSRIVEISFIYLEMTDNVAFLLWTLFLAFVVMMFLSYRGTVSNSRISLFSMVIVFYEAGNDDFRTIENETE